MTYPKSFAFVAFWATVSLPISALAAWAVSYDESTNASFVSADAPDLAAARSAALSGCSKLSAKAEAVAGIKGGDQGKGCKIIASRESTGILVVAKSRYSIGVGINVDAGVASDMAVDDCKQADQFRAPYPCKVTSKTNVLQVPATAPASAAVGADKRTKDRCTNQCVNGACIRTFDDGREEEWQAPRVRDPRTGEITWDTTNPCGG